MLHRQYPVVSGRADGRATNVVGLPASAVTVAPYVALTDGVGEQGCGTAVPGGGKNSTDEPLTPDPATINVPKSRFRGGTHRAHAYWGLNSAGVASVEDTSSSYCTGIEIRPRPAINRSTERELPLDVIFSTEVPETSTVHCGEFQVRETGDSTCMDRYDLGMQDKVLVMPYPNVLALKLRPRGTHDKRWTLTPSLVSDRLVVHAVRVQGVVAIGMNPLSAEQGHSDDNGPKPIKFTASSSFSVDSEPTASGKVSSRTVVLQRLTIMDLEGASVTLAASFKPQHQPQGSMQSPPSICGTAQHELPV